MKTATILSVIALVSSASVALHVHSAKVPLANKGDVKILVSMDALDDSIDIILEHRNGLRMTIARMQTHLIQVELSPVQDARILQIRNRIKNEIEGYQKLLQQQQQDLHDAKKTKSALKMQLSTA